MIRAHFLSTVLALGAATAVPAQSKTDRDLARTMDQVGRTVERSVEQALRDVDRALSRSLEKSKNKNLDKTIHRSIEQAIEQSLAAVEHSIDSKYDRTHERSVDKAIEKSVDEALEKTFDKLDKVLDRDLDRSVDRIVERALEQGGERSQRPSRARDSHQELQQGGERIDTSFTFSRGGVVDLTSVSGDIVVTGWSRGEARVRASTERGRLRWHFTSSRLSIETETYRGRGGESRFEISVPEGVRVILRSTSGSLAAKGIRGSVDANTNSGDIEVVDAADVELESISGDIMASRLRGEVQATSVGGDVEIQDVEARSIRVESTNGDVSLLGVRSRDIAASTVSGDVSYRGGIDSGGQYEFHSHSGDVMLDIPSNVSARFSVETFSGELDAGGFPVTLQPGTRGQRRSRRLEFTLGGGDARVIAETFSGNIELRRESRR